MSFPGQHIFQRFQKGLLVLGGVYAVAVVLLAIPYFQSNTVYLNNVRLPLFADYDTPEKYGLSPNKTLNLKIQTPDNETLGAWFVLSDPYYRSLPSIPSEFDTHITASLEHHPTLLFLHGNAATRAYHARIQHYQAFSSRLSANVLAVDYRGFGDSTGHPSEAGLVRDGRAAWDWLIAHGAKRENVIIVGHSLGTGVTSQLAAQLSDEGIIPRGIVLLSPFSSIREVLNTYHILGAIPLMKPLAMIPFAQNLITWALVHKFDSLAAVPRIKGQVLIAHAENDWDIPHSHSEVLFNAFLEPYLPKIDLLQSGGSWSTADWTQFRAQSGARSTRRGELVKRTELRKFGTLEEFEADGRKVALLKTLAGGHDYLGVQEGVQDVIRTTFGLV